MRERRTMAILGGGPIGLECLVRARAEGWDAKLYERGRIGEGVRGWGHVRMFSPLAMNVPVPRMRHLEVEAGPDELLTGAEYVERYLEPLARQPALGGRVFIGTEALALSREGLRKGDEIATPERGRRPFRLLLRSEGGERVEEADVVLDATGTFATHNWLGQGGIPAVGERGLEQAIDYRLPDIPARNRKRFLGQHTLVVGAGHSAATAILWFAELAAKDPETRVTWVTRADGSRPVREVAGDPLEERSRVAASANDLAEVGAPWLARLPGSVLLEVRRSGSGFTAAVARGGSREASWTVADRILALVGYRPELELARELQLQTCWATEGTYPLAAALLSFQGPAAADCLAAGGFGPDTLVHPEAGFFTLGAKSYGRNSNFLIRAGLEQVDHVFALLGDRGGGPRSPARTS